MSARCDRLSGRVCLPDNESVGSGLHLEHLRAVSNTKLRSNVVDLQEYVAFEKSALPQKDSQSPEAERPLKGG